ncbi:MAG TPA: RteC domain-containing protein [Cyclobacteriaceae bacterium]|nr:RteC domain-containing protein [Cyclobacteriaceae bacterium]
MIKPFDALYVDLEKALKLGEKGHAGPEKYLHGIELIRGAIGKLRTRWTKLTPCEPATEIEFFRNVWPLFHAKLFLYICLYGTDLRRATMPADAWATAIANEERQIQAFFRQNEDFWQYYRSGAPAINEQFTRAYSQSRIFEPMALVLDQEGATLASYRAAWCLAMDSYGKWLKEERALLSAGAVSAADLGYSFGGSDADLAEWLFGLQAVGAILFEGRPADISRLQKWARLAVGKEVPNIYDRGRVLRNRKKEQLAFTKKIAAALQKKWDQAAGKFE